MLDPAINIRFAAQLLLPLISRKAIILARVSADAMPPGGRVNSRNSGRSADLPGDVAHSSLSD